MAWWTWLAIGVAAIAVSWAVLVVLAARLPRGRSRTWPRSCPRVRRPFAASGLIRESLGAPGSPWGSRSSGWLSPIDLIPEFLPVIGPLDDVVVVALALRYAARQVPRSVLLEAWPANPAVIERLLVRVRGCRRRSP